MKSLCKNNELCETQNHEIICDQQQLSPKFANKCKVGEYKMLTAKKHLFPQKKTPSHFL